MIFFNLPFGCPRTNFRPLSRAATSLTRCWSLYSITEFRPESHWQRRYEAAHPVGFEPETSRFSRNTQWANLPLSATKPQFLNALPHVLLSVRFYIIFVCLIKFQRINLFQSHVLHHTETSLLISNENRMICNYMMGDNGHAWKLSK